MILKTSGKQAVRSKILTFRRRAVDETNHRSFVDARGLRNSPTADYLTNAVRRCPSWQAFDYPFHFIIRDERIRKEK